MKKIRVIGDQKLDIVITIPQSTNWDEYQKEIDLVKDGKYVMNFKVNSYPKLTEIGKRCYLRYKGNIIGYMIISGLNDQPFKCATTGKVWFGKFIQRSGEFHKIDPIPMKGFQGYRYFQQ